jgi:hypothetical protein
MVTAGGFHGGKAFIPSITHSRYLRGGEGKMSVLACNRTGISLRLTHSLFITLTEVLQLYLNLCIISTDLFLLSRSRYGCEFLAESCDFYRNILFPGLNLVQTEGNNEVPYRI